MTRYDLLYLAVAPVAAPVIAYRHLRHGKYRESGPGMLGRHLGTEPREHWTAGCIWVHAVSVGEVAAARAMLPLLRREFEGVPILLTTVTETGQAQARSLVPALADEVRYYPADFSWIVRKFVEVYRPRMLMLMETELWPNALLHLHARGIPVFVVNGKISERSRRGYARLGSLMRRAFSAVTVYCMQTEGDAHRISELSSKNENVFVTGNCKFDMPAVQLSLEELRDMRELCGVREGQPVIVAGSTHAGEEDMIIAAFRKLRETFPSLSLIIAPRHPERFEQVWDLVRATGVPARRISNGFGAPEPTIILADKMGILGRLYALADVAIVAGSFVPGIGGHNILEPAMHGVPVIYGPYMFGQPDMVRILGHENGGLQIEGSALESQLRKLLSDRETSRRLGECGREAVERNRGAAQRNMDIISRFLQHAGDPFAVVTR